MTGFFNVGDRPLQIYTCYLIQMGACLSKMCPLFFKSSDDLLTDCQSDETFTIRTSESFTTNISAEDQKTDLEQSLLQPEPKRTQSLTQTPSAMPYTIAVKDLAYNQLRRHRSDDTQINTNEDVLTQRIMQGGEKIKADTRKINDRTAEYPYNCIGLIYRITNNKKIVIGTGFIISSHLVLTAAHNVFNFTKGVYKGLKFYPAIHGQIRDAEERDAFYVWVSQEYKQEKEVENPKCDYALIILNRGIQRDRYIMIGQDYPQANTAEIYGYPTDKNQNNKKGTYHQFGAQGLVREIKEESIFYCIDTMPGQSGSPIVVQFVSGLYFAIGIHVRYDDIRRLNCGTQLTNSKIQNIKNWISSRPIEEKCIIINCQTMTQLPKYDGPLKIVQPLRNIDLYLQQIEIQRNCNAESAQTKGLLIKIAKNYRILGRYDQCISYLQQAGSIKSKSQSDNACIENEKGMVYFLQKQFEKSKNSFKNAFQIYQKLKSQKYMAAALSNIGNCNNKLGDYPKAAKYYMKAIELNQRLSQQKQGDLANCYCNYAIALQNQKQLEEAEKYHIKALQSKKTRKMRCEEEDIYLYYFNLANCHYKLKKFQASFNQYSTTIDVMINLALTEHKVFKKSLKRLKKIVNELSQVEMAKEDLGKMCKVIDSVKEYDEELNQKMNLLKQKIHSAV